MNNDHNRLLVIGINYRTTTITEREEFQINKKELSGALAAITAIKEVEGAVIISTCNRLEYYLVLNNSAEPFDIIQEFYKKYNNSDPSIIHDRFYTYICTECYAG